MTPSGDAPPRFGDCHLGRTRGTDLIVAKGNLKLWMALTKAWDQKLLEQAATVRLLKRAGSNENQVRPGKVALFGPLMAGRP